MRLEQIKYFIDTAEYLSITQAANINFISPQALSSALLSLEKELGYSLLIRSSNRISLSSEGIIFLEYAKEIIHSYTNALSSLDAYSSKDKSLSGIINIYSASNIADMILPDAISYFSFRYPDIKIKITELDIDNIMSSLQSSSNWDIFFLTATEHYIGKLNTQLDSFSFNISMLMKDEIVLCTKTSSPLAKSKALFNDEIATYLQNNHLNISFYNFVPTNDEPSRIYSCSSCITTSNNSSLHKIFLQQNIALTLMPFLSYKYKFREKDFTYIRLKEATETEHVMIYKTNNAIIKLFVDYIDYYCSKNFQNQADK